MVLTKWSTLHMKMVSVVNITSDLHNLQFNLSRCNCNEIWDKYKKDEQWLIQKYLNVNFTAVPSEQVSLLLLEKRLNAFTITLKITQWWYIYIYYFSTLLKRRHYSVICKINWILKEASLILNIMSVALQRRCPGFSLVWLSDLEGFKLSLVCCCFYRVAFYFITAPTWIIKEVPLLLVEGGQGLELFRFHCLQYFCHIGTSVRTEGHASAVFMGACINSCYIKAEARGLEPNFGIMSLTGSCSEQTLSNNITVVQWLSWTCPEDSGEGGIIDFTSVLLINFFLLLSVWEYCCKVYITDKVWMKTFSIFSCVGKSCFKP